MISPRDNEGYDPMDDRDEYEKAMADKTSGELLVGTTGHGEVVINHPDIDADKDGVGHIVFSPEQARNLGLLLLRKAKEARAEQRPLHREAAK